MSDLLHHEEEGVSGLDGQAGIPHDPPKEVPARSKLGGRARVKSKRHRMSKRKELRKGG